MSREVAVKMSGSPDRCELVSKWLTGLRDRSHMCMHTQHRAAAQPFPLRLGLTFYGVFARRSILARTHAVRVSLGPALPLCRSSRLGRASFDLLVFVTRASDVVVRNKTL